MGFTENITKVTNIFIFLIILQIPLNNATNCSGKAFHCVNSTHFQICVDFGNSVSFTVDDFVIKCPEGTVCNRNNYYECEVPLTTTAATTRLLSDVTNDYNIPGSVDLVKNNSIQTESSTDYIDEYSAGTLIANDMKTGPDMENLPTTLTVRHIAISPDANVTQTRNTSASSIDETKVTYANADNNLQTQEEKSTLTVQKEPTLSEPKVIATNSTLLLTNRNNTENNPTENMLEETIGVFTDSHSTVDRNSSNEISKSIKTKELLLEKEKPVVENQTNLASDKNVPDVTERYMHESAVKTLHVHNDTSVLQTANSSESVPSDMKSFTNNKNESQVQPSPESDLSLIRNDLKSTEGNILLGYETQDVLRRKNTTTESSFLTTSGGLHLKEFVSESNFPDQINFVVNGLLNNRDAQELETTDDILNLTALNGLSQNVTESMVSSNLTANESNFYTTSEKEVSMQNLSDSISSTTNNYLMDVYSNIDELLQKSDNNSNVKISTSQLQTDDLDILANNKTTLLEKSRKFLSMGDSVVVSDTTEKQINFEENMNNWTAREETNTFTIHAVTELNLKLTSGMNLLNHLSNFVAIEDEQTNGGFNQTEDGNNETYNDSTNVAVINETDKQNVDLSTIGLNILTENTRSVADIADNTTNLRSDLNLTSYLQYLTDTYLNSSEIETLFDSNDPSKAINRKSNDDNLSSRPFLPEESTTISSTNFFDIQSTDFNTDNSQTKENVTPNLLTYTERSSIDNNNSKTDAPNYTNNMLQNESETNKQTGSEVLAEVELIAQAAENSTERVSTLDTENMTISFSLSNTVRNRTDEKIFEINNITDPKITRELTTEIIEGENEYNKELLNYTTESLNKNTTKPILNTSINYDRLDRDMFYDSILNIKENGTQFSAVLNTSSSIGKGEDEVIRINETARKNNNALNSENILYNNQNITNSDVSEPSEQKIEQLLFGKIENAVGNETITESLHDNNASSFKTSAKNIDFDNQQTFLLENKTNADQFNKNNNKSDTDRVFVKEINTNNYNANTVTSDFNNRDLEIHGTVKNYSEMEIRHEISGLGISTSNNIKSNLIIKQPFIEETKQQNVNNLPLQEPINSTLFVEIQTMSTNKYFLENFTNIQIPNLKNVYQTPDKEFPEREPIDSSRRNNEADDFRNITNNGSQTYDLVITTTSMPHLSLENLQGNHSINSTDMKNTSDVLTLTKTQTTNKNKSTTIYSENFVSTTQSTESLFTKDVLTTDIFFSDPSDISPNKKLPNITIKSTSSQEAIFNADVLSKTTASFTIQSETLTKFKTNIKPTETLHSVIIETHSNLAITNKPGDNKITSETIQNENCDQKKRIAENKISDIKTNDEKTNLNIASVHKEPFNSYFDCTLWGSGKYSDKYSCNKYYICVDGGEPLTYFCPEDMVFSDVTKTCTTNLAHCVRDNELMCIIPGRYYDIFTTNTYYICIKQGNRFIRFRFHCHFEYHLDKNTVTCVKIPHMFEKLVSDSFISFSSDSSEEVSVSAKKNSSDYKNSEEKGAPKCKRVGKIPHPTDCHKYYQCHKNLKSELRKKVKKCDSDELFDKNKRKCVSAESAECY